MKIWIFTLLLTHANAQSPNFDDGTEANGLCRNCSTAQNAPADFGSILDTLECRSRDPEACAMFADLNRIRRDHGLPSLKYDSICEKAAIIHGRDMAEHSFFDHTGSDGSTLKERYSRVSGGRIPFTLRENIFMQSGAPASAKFANVEFMNSPGHRENILASDISHTGVARIIRGSETYYVQCFSQL